MPNINHFGSQGSTGGPLTVLNIDFIREASFSTGGFGVQYGDRTASLSSFSLREGNSERLAGEVNLSATGFGVIGEGPMGKNGTFLASVRRSYLDLVFRAADFSFIPEYWDAQMKVTQRIGTRSALSLVAVGALDNVILDEETADDRLDNSRIAAPDQKSYFAGLTWNYSLPKGLLTATLGRTWTRFATSQYDTLLAPVYLNRSEEGDNSLKTELAWQFSPRLQVTFGNTLRIADQLDYDVLLAGEYRTDSLNQPAAAGGRHHVHGAPERHLRAGVHLRGQRPDHRRACAATGTPSSTPSGWRRGSGPTSRSASRGSLNLSLGQYYQAPPFIWLVGDPGNIDRLEPIRADAAILGYERLFRPDLKGQVEVYYKRYADYPARLFRPEAVLQPTGFDDVTSDIPSGLEPLSSIGTGRSYGVELQLQKKFSTVPLYGLVSLTANRSEYAGVDSVLLHRELRDAVHRQPAGGVAVQPEVGGERQVPARHRPAVHAVRRRPAPRRGSGISRSTTSSGFPPTPRWTSGSTAGGRSAPSSWTCTSTSRTSSAPQNVTGTYWNERTQQEEFDEGLGILPTIGVNVEF